MRHVVEMWPSFVKLDIRLVRRIDTDEAGRALVAGMQSYALNLGCSYVVSTRARRGLLGVGLGEGYLVGRPAPAAVRSTPTGAVLDFLPA